MAHDTVSATTTIPAPAQAVFRTLADPANHVAIDGTGWLCESRDGKPLTEAGQIFRMAMYHSGHPNGHYEMSNQVLVFDPPRAISWRPGYRTGEGNLDFGGWLWRYDLEGVGASETRVTLTYDWSAVPPVVRERFERFPPFAADHLSNSLAHLARLVEDGPSSLP